MTEPLEGDFTEQPPLLEAAADPTAQDRQLAIRPDMSVGLVREPDVILAEAHKAAEALTKVISSKPRKVVFNGKQYLEYEDWILLGEFYGVAVKIASTHQVDFGPDGKGWEATAEVIDKRTGYVIGGAQGMCLDTEQNWRNKPTFQLRSMAQTRAGSKALSGRLRWIPVLAGYSGTPSEEMEGAPAAGAAPAAPAAPRRAPAARPAAAKATPAAQPAPAVAERVKPEDKELLENARRAYEADPKKGEQVRAFMVTNKYKNWNDFYQRATDEHILEILKVYGLA